MKILVLSQVYWPDNVAVAQHLADLCTHLSAKGHAVTVFTSQYPYEEPESGKYPLHEAQEGVTIKRLRNTGFGKKHIIGRLSDFFTFNMLIIWEMLFLKKGQFDVVLGLTSPPLLSFFGVFFAKLKGYRFCYWTMDLQPELSIQSGLIKANSFGAKVLTFMGDFVFKRSDKIVVLDKYMGEYVRSRGGHGQRIEVIPVWPVMGKLYEGTRMDNPFRQSNGFGDKIVLMYSGNHAFVHPLDTVLEAAEMLRDDPRFLFVFIGGGVRKQDVTQFKAAKNLQNIVQLPYQPRELIHLSLGSSDFQIVILGDGQVGYTHPNKIYGAMFIGKPILYVGPGPSHVTDLFDACPGNLAVSHGQAAVLRDKLLAAANNIADLQSIGHQNQQYAFAHFHPKVLIKKMASAVENT